VWCVFLCRYIDRNNARERDCVCLFVCGSVCICVRGWVHFHRLGFMSAGDTNASAEVAGGIAPMIGMRDAKLCRFLRLGLASAAAMQGR
jgi:hypothetical protein